MSLTNEERETWRLEAFYSHPDHSHSHFPGSDPNCLQCRIVRLDNEVHAIEERALEHRRYTAQVWDERENMHVLWLKAEEKAKTAREVLRALSDACADRVQDPTWRPLQRARELLDTPTTEASGSR